MVRVIICGQYFDQSKLFELIYLTILEPCEGRDERTDNCTSVNMGGSCCHATKRWCQWLKIDP